jgi:ornithine cyclodeaminase
MTLILGLDDLRAVLADVGPGVLLDQLIERLRSTLAGLDESRFTTPDRTGFSYREPELGLIEWMPALEVGRRVAVKTVGYHPANPIRRRLPSVLATTSVYDTSDGSLRMVCEATLLTALRTGAASALATEVLAHPEASTLALVGCGAQAVTQAQAIVRVRPIERIVAHDTDRRVAATLLRRLRAAGVTAQVALVGRDGLAQLVAEADVLCTCTTVDPGAGPVIPVVEHRPWLHINAVGADFPGKIELPTAYLDQALVCPDVPSQCLIEGECQQLSPDDLGPTLADLVRLGPELGRHRHLPTVFDSTGWALQDLVAADLLGLHAERLGVGTVVDLQPSPSQHDRYDPYDPYSQVRVDPTVMSIP